MTMNTTVRKHAYLEYLSTNYLTMLQRSAVSLTDRHTYRYTLSGLMHEVSTVGNLKEQEQAIASRHTNSSVHAVGTFKNTHINHEFIYGQEKNTCIACNAHRSTHLALHPYADVAYWKADCINPPPYCFNRQSNSYTLSSGTCRSIPPLQRSIRQLYLR